MENFIAYMFSIKNLIDANILSKILEIKFLILP